MFFWMTWVKFEMRNRSSSAVVNDLANKLRRDIALGTLTPGARLNIEALKRDHKVSHPSIREALALLAGEGYVSAQDNKGYRVLAYSLDDLKDSSRLRAELECVGFRWSVENATREWRASVVAAHHLLSEVEADMLNDPASFAIEWDARNLQFHQALIGNCGSPRLLETMGNLYDMTRRYRLMDYSNTQLDHQSWLTNSAEEHAKIKECALNGDIETGTRLLREHTTKSVAQSDGVILHLSQNR